MCSTSCSDTSAAAVAGMAATAYLHQFYARCSMADHPPWYMTIAAVFLALKVEELPRKLHEILRRMYEVRY